MMGYLMRKDSVIRMSAMCYKFVSESLTYLCKKYKIVLL